MSKYEKIYQTLRKQYTDEEIADSMLIPADMTVAEKAKADEEIRAFRFKLLRERTEEQRIFSDLMRLKIQMEDYIKKEPYSDAKSFGRYLEEYVRILGRTKKKLSEDLNVHYTKLSRIFNDREAPNVELMYKLEEHSGGLIPAVIWWKLLIKKQEFLIKKDKETRKQVASEVRDVVKVA